MKQFIKNILPPIVFDLKKAIFGTKRQLMWSKPLSGWAEAKRMAKGYNADNILERVLDATRLVKSGMAVYERDSVIFDQIQYDWPLLAVLQKIALENNNSLVLVDFGGSLGSTYFQNKEWLANINIKWIIVEQQHFVEIGKNEFETKELIFEFSLDDAFKHQPNVILFSSVLQYLEKPKEIMAKVMESEVEHIVIDRTSIVKQMENDVVTLQEVPEEIYKASYPCWFFKEDNLISFFLSTYDLYNEFASFCDLPFVDEGITYQWKGYYFKKK